MVPYWHEHKICLKPLRSWRVTFPAEVGRGSGDWEGPGGRGNKKWTNRGLLNCTQNAQMNTRLCEWSNIRETSSPKTENKRRLGSYRPCTGRGPVSARWTTSLLTHWLTEILLVVSEIMSEILIGKEKNSCVRKWHFYISPELLQTLNRDMYWYINSLFGL